MKMLKVALISLMLILCGICSRGLRAQSATTPAESATTQAVTPDDFKAYIQQSKTRNERWGLVEEKYVLDNFQRPELNQAIDKWQARNQTVLSKDVRIMVMVDYLLTELNGMKVLPLVLDSIAKGEQTSVGNQVKTQVAGTAFRSYQMGRVRVEVNLDRVDVDIDGKFASQVANKSMFVVTAGQSHVVVVRQSGFADCSKSVTVAEGRTEVVTCTMNPR